MKRNYKITVSLLAWTLAALLLAAQVSAVSEVGIEKAVSAEDVSIVYSAVEGVEELSRDVAVSDEQTGETADREELIVVAENVDAVESTAKPVERETGDTENENGDVETENMETADAENLEETAELQGLFGWKSRPDLSVSMEGWALGQSPNRPIVTGNVEAAPLVCVYRDMEGGIVSDIAAAPAGTYTVTVFLEESEDYTAASARAVFTITPAYTVTWVSEDGSLLEVDRFVTPGSKPRYDGEEPAKARTTAYTYSFLGWDPALTTDSAVTDDITYTAVFTETLNQYSVDFLDDDGTVLKHASYGYGTQAAEIVPPANPQKGITSQYAFTFRGWTPEIADVTGDAKYTAVYDKTPVQIYHPVLDSKSFYTIFVESCEGGAVRVLPAEARPGTPVLLTPVPDSGYVLDVLIARGLGRTETLGLARNGDRYSFTMPSFDVSVHASFRKLEPSTDNQAASEEEPTQSQAEPLRHSAETVVKGIEETTTAPESVEKTQKSAQIDLDTQSSTQIDKGTHNSTQTVQIAQESTADRDTSEVVRYSLVNTGFSDVPGTAYYAKAVRWAAQENVLPGVSEASFAPGNPCTRAQMVLALWRAAGSPKPSIGYGNPFSDVDVNSPYYEAVLWAMENGVTRGTTATTFSPDRPVSRAQAVTLLYRLKGSRADRLNPFSDAARGQYFYEAALWACAIGITRGTTASTFSPHAPCTRAQAAAFLYRTFEE